MRRLQIVITSFIEDTVKGHSGGQELGKLVSTARNTYVNAGSVEQIDFHQSDKSKVTFPLLSFLSSNDFMETERV